MEAALAAASADLRGRKVGAGEDRNGGKGRKWAKRASARWGDVGSRRERVGAPELGEAGRGGGDVLSSNGQRLLERGDLHEAGGLLLDKHFAAQPQRIHFVGGPGLEVR